MRVREGARRGGVQGASDATDAWGRKRRTHLPVRVRKVAEAWSATVPLPRTFLEGAGCGR